MDPKPNYFSRTSFDSSNRLDEVIEMQRGVISSYIHLIASACYPFPAVLKALAEPSFVLPAEGMPGDRYLPGAEVMDLVENEGEKLILELFKNTSGYRATLQPHSGTQANQIAYNAVLEPEDTVLCLKPSDGGHISHTVLISRRHKSYNYGLNAKGQIDYENLELLAMQHNPKLIIVGGSALPRQIDFVRCAEIARKVGAYLHADVSHTATFIAAGIHQNTFPHCDFVTFSMSKNLRGPNSGILIYRDIFEKPISDSIFPTTQGGANETNMLGKLAALLEWTDHDLATYANSIVGNAQVMARAFIESGVKLTTGGTDCHILLLELQEDNVSGSDIERRLESVGILANKNLIPFDKRGPRETSGIRIGATNLAILEYSDTDIQKLAGIITAVIQGRSVSRDSANELMSRYPAPKYQ